VLSSRIFEGTPPPEHADVIITQGRVIVDDSAAASDSVTAYVDRGADAIKVYNNLNAAAYRGITVRARQLGVPVVGHVPFSVGLSGAFDAGQRSIEHLRGYLHASWPPGAPDPPGADFRSRLISWRRTDTTRLRALAAETARRGIWNVPTIAVHLDLLPVARISELTARPGWQACMRGARADPVAARARIPYFAVMSDADFAATQDGLRVQKQLVRMLHEAGAGLLVGTDRLPWGYAFHWELEELVSAGLTPWDVLYAATLGAARFLGQDARHGSITRNKAAELVLLEANPLEDIRNTQRIAAVVVRGRLLEAAALDSLRISGCKELSG
jgi:imidazolonepropionase-like amidohydrolase